MLQNRKAFHCGIATHRVWVKNVSLLHDILLTVETRPDIIAISETKINENYYANINLPGYNFMNTNSKSQAGGVGLYIANNIEFSRKTDFDISHDGIESCWVELACYKPKKYCYWLCIPTSEK